MDMKSLEAEMSVCVKCASIFAERFVDPIKQSQSLVARPIFAGAPNAPVMLIGQAPGITEYEKGKAFQGQAGGDIREIFDEAGVRDSSFEKLVYQTSVTKCFPGRKKVKRKDSRTGQIVWKEEDRVPNATEIKNCIPYLARQISSISPRVIVLLGGLAIDGYLRLRGLRINGGLEAYVGRTEQWNGIEVVFFPHTSGSSRWLNIPSNRRLFYDAKQELAAALRRAEIVA